MKNLSSELVSFIEKRLGMVENVSKNSPIEKTYGMAGLDSLMFYNNFIDEFEIVIPLDFDISHYCSSDHDLLDFFKRIFSRKYRKRNWYVDLTIGDLDEMIRTRKWKIHQQHHPSGER